MLYMPYCRLSAAHQTQHKAGTGRMSALGANRTRQDGGNDVNDPNRSLAGSKSRSAAVPRVVFLLLRSPGFAP